MNDVPEPTPAHTRTLSLEQGLELGLKSNLAVRLTGERKVEASAIARQAQAPLRPHLSLGASESNQTINLASLGIGSFPGINVTTVGPFFSFDSRVRLAQTILGSADAWRARYGRGGVVLAELQERLATQQVATTVELLYLDLLRSRRVIDDANANLDLARSLLKLAQDQKTAGVGTGLDVTRADTQLAQDEVYLAQAQRIADEAQLRLLHAIGLPLHTQLILTAPLADETRALPALDAAVAEARQQRVELLVGRQHIAMCEMQIRATQAEHHPVVALQADYGLAGTGPVRSQGVHKVTLVMSLPILDGGMASARVAQAQASLTQAQSSVQTAQAAVASARARQHQAQSQVITATGNWRQQQAQVESARAEATRTATDVQRYRQLFAQDEVSRQQLDHAIAASRVAAASLSTARHRADVARAQIVEAEAAAATGAQNVAQAESGVTEAQTRIAQVQAQIGDAQGRLDAANAAPQQVEVKRSEAETADSDVKHARVDVKNAELQLSYCKVVAPRDGRVTRKAVEVGAYVREGQALMALVAPEIWVVANFKETQLKQMRVGQTVEIEVDAYPDRRLRGRVDSFQAGSGARFSVMPPENATGNYVKVVQRVPVKIVFDEDASVLKRLGPGLSVLPSVRVR